MSDTTANPLSVPSQTTTGPRPPAPGGPVLIGDAITPLAGSTLLALTWPKRSSDR